MDHISSSFSSPVKSRGYRHRSRPVRTSGGTAAKTARVDRKNSSYRHRPKPSSSKQSARDSSIVIPFPVPSIITTNWLLRTAPVLLARHLVYARGLWPMSVPQLLSAQQQEQNQEVTQANGLSIHDYAEKGRLIAASGKRRRLNDASRVNPSLRRKQQRAMDQITRLGYEWTRYAAAVSYSAGDYNGDNNVEQIENSIEQEKLPRFLLIMLGASYGQGRELYLLDFQSLIDDDTRSSANDGGTTAFTQEQEHKFETMLARKLISALMNHTSEDDRPSVANSLPAPTSPSFRLSFTAGLENHTNTATISPLSTVSWIPRAKFPFSQKKSQSRLSSRTQSLVTIRFVRSKKQNQAMQHHLCQNECKNAEDPQSNDLHAALDQSTWMSLSTIVKGFRL